MCIKGNTPAAILVAVGLAVQVQDFKIRKQRVCAVGVQATDFSV